MGLLRKINKIIVKIIFINFGGRKEKSTILFIFSTYFVVFLLNFDRESSLDVELNSTSNEYALGILLMGPATPETRNT